MTTIGYATLQIIPSMDGVSDSVRKQLGAMPGLGKTVGKQLGDNMSAGVDQAAKRVEAASKKMEAARRKEADAAGKVRVAEAQLQSLRDKGVTDAGRLAAAEEKVAKAQRDHVAASESAAEATKSLTAAQKDTAKAADTATESVSRSSQVLDKFGKVATVAVAAVGAAVVKAGIDFQSMRNEIRVGTGAAGDDLKGLVETAKEIGKETPASFGEIGTAVADLNTRLGLTGEPLQRVGRQFLELANMGIDADINKVSQALSGFGISGAGVEGAMDNLFQVSQATGLSVNELATSAVKAGPQLRGFGFNLGEAAALAGQLDKSGMDADKTLAAMARAMAAFAKDGKSGKEALMGAVGEIGSLIEKGEEAAAIDMAGKIFGTRGAGAFVDAVKTGTFSVEDLIAATGATGDTITGVADETRTMSESFAILKNEALAGLEPVAMRVMDALTGMAKALAENRPLLIGVAGAVGGLVAAYGVLRAVAVAASVAQGVHAAATGAGTAALGMNKIALGAHAVASGVSAVATKGWAAAQWVLNAALNANPIGLIVLALAALVGGIVLAYKNSETFRNIVQAAWEGIKGAVSGAWNVIRPIIDGIGTAVTWLWQNAFVPAWDGIKGAVERAWTFIETVWDGLKLGVDVIGTLVSALWQSHFVPAWEGIKTAVSTAWDFIKAVFDKFKTGFDNLKTGLVTAANAIRDGISNAFSGLADIIKTPLRVLGRFLQNVPDSIMGISIPGAATLKNWGENLAGLKAGGAVRDPSGRLRGPGTGTSDSIFGVNAAGVPIVRVSDGEGVVRKTAMDRGGDALVRALNAGWTPSSEFLHRMLPGFKRGGAVREGAIPDLFYEDVRPGSDSDGRPPATRQPYDGSWDPGLQSGYRPQPSGGYFDQEWPIPGWWFLPTLPRDPRIRALAGLKTGGRIDDWTQGKVPGSGERGRGIWVGDEGTPSKEPGKGWFTGIHGWFGGHSVDLTPMLQLQLGMVGGMDAYKNIKPWDLRGYKTGGVIRGSRRKPDEWLASLGLDPDEPLGPGRAPEGGLQQRTVALSRTLSAVFPEIKTIGGYRQDALKWHPSGLALDVAIPGGTTRGGVNPEGKALGDQIWKFVKDNADELGVDIKASLWQTDAGGDHYNHLHLVTTGGGRPEKGQEFFLPSKLQDKIRAAQKPTSASTGKGSAAPGSTPVEPDVATATSSSSGGGSGSYPTSISGWAGFAAEQIVGGQVASALDMFGVPDSPGWLQGISQLIGGLSISDNEGNKIFGGSGSGSSLSNIGSMFGNTAQTGSDLTPIAARPTAHGSTGGAPPGPLVDGQPAPQPGVVYNITARDTEDAFIRAQRQERERAAAKLARF